jgi:hypothetical protein
MSRWGHQSREARHELRRRHEAHPFVVLDSVADPAILEQRKPLERERRASAVAEQAFARGRQPSGHADTGVEIELQMLDTKAFGWLERRAAQCCLCVLLGAAVLCPALNLTHAQAALQAPHPWRVVVRVFGAVFLALASKVAVLFEPAHGACSDGRHDLFQI